MVNEAVYHSLLQEFSATNTTLVAVSKIKPAADIQHLYDLGQRDFGENYVQELVEKQAQLPADIRWHFIGHLQSNKVKYIAPFVHLVQGVDSFRLLQEINKQAAKCNRTIKVLLQVHIATEETKYGLDETELTDLLEFYTAQQGNLSHIEICGLMGMASFSENEEQVKEEFKKLYDVFQVVKKTYFLGQAGFHILSMGMSGDYTLAIQQGSTMVRIGSMLFGRRN